MTAPQLALERYRWASQYINGLIQGPPSPPPGLSADEIRARQQARLDRLRRFLDFIDNPQDRFHSIHVTGTSGKGSTSALIAAILTAAGRHTGLHVSPYLQVETEKLVVDGRLLAGERFADYVAEMDGAMRRWSDQGGDRLTYGEFWVALTFLAFARQQVEWGVIEVGAGGRFDLTNVLRSDVAVITSVGFDHVRTLGPELTDIAWHKAGIIKPSRPAVTTVTGADTLQVIRQEAAKQAAPLTELAPGRDYELSGTSAGGIGVRDPRSGRCFDVGLAGAFQAANAAAAIGAIRAIPGTTIRDDQIALGLAAARFPGRMEIVQERPRVVLDGAHNPDKMRSLAQSVRLLPQPRRRILVLGALDGHDYLQNARVIAPLSDQVIITAPHAVERAAASTDALAGVMQELGKPVRVVLEPLEAIGAALAAAEAGDEVLVTGSLYLVGQVRERWYPSEVIVVQQTCWPERQD